MDGVATVLHGYARFTADVDPIIDLEPARARTLVAALVELGFVPRTPVDALDFADSAIRQRWISEKGMQVFSMVDRHNPMRVVDLFADHSIDLEALWARASTIALDTTTVRVASIPDLIQLSLWLDVRRISRTSRSSSVCSRGARMTAEAKDDAWPVSWVANRAILRESVAAATPAQRLAWLEAALRLAHHAGGLSPSSGGGHPPALSSRASADRWASVNRPA